ncbi:MAG: exodeoxyribonuclease VII large subunit [Planctomycetes bacterium]|nr:exodeoxyribonuclease VII large subunit [Planctomycetota bacterium]
MVNNQSKIYTVSEITAVVKAVLANNLPSRLTIGGEITNWVVAGSGHCYFDLKDEAAVIPCVMWKGSFSKVQFAVENGLAVLAGGRVDVYEPHGKYQFYVERITPAGKGDLQLAFEQMYKKLKAEGLFEDEHKKELPKYPQRIGILTSEAGAAVHDIVDSIFNRWSCVKLYLYPVAVQGKGSAEKIAAAIGDVNRRNEKLRLDVLIVGRGGGSLEDLWAFNEEVLARAIFESEIPVISAVGHEVDVTIADLVADARASTPTKAGVLAVPDMQEVLGQLGWHEEKLNTQVNWLVQTSQQRLDELGIRVLVAMKQLLAEAKGKLASSYEQVVKLEPQRFLKDRALVLTNLKSRVEAGVTEIVRRRQIELAGQENRLRGLNPKSILGRGYSITTNKSTGGLVKNLKDVKVGEEIVTELAGEKLIESKVIKK